MIMTTTKLKKLRGYQNQNESFYNNIEAIDNLPSNNKKGESLTKKTHSLRNNRK